MSPVLIAACEKAWAALTADLTLTCDATATQHGLNRKTFANWVGRRHPGELQALRAKAGLRLYGERKAAAPSRATAGSYTR